MHPVPGGLGLPAGLRSRGFLADNAKLVHRGKSGRSAKQNAVGDRIASATPAKDRLPGLGA